MEYEIILKYQRHFTIQAANYDEALQIARNKAELEIEADNRLLRANQLLSEPIIPIGKLEEGK